MSRLNGLSIVQRETVHSLYIQDRLLGIRCKICMVYPVPQTIWKIKISHVSHICISNYIRAIRDVSF